MKMKKLFLTMMVALLSVAAGAQVYVGGEVSLWRDYDKNHTSFTVQPEVGYRLSDHWAIGTVVGFSHSYKKGVKANGAIISPYARYHYAKFGPVSLFLDGGFGFNTYKYKGAGSSKSAWQVGVTPGVSVDVAKNLSFVAHVGFLGWRDADDDRSQFGENGFGFRLSSNDLRFGMLYHF